jgi:UDP:flavonoid glycosyltransferase YjiC (YdhE family)
VTRPTIAIFCMAETGHFKQIRPLITDLARAGFAVHVLTHGMFGLEVERTGARLVDIFADHPLDRADDASMPFPSRYVTFAGTYAEEIIAQVKAIDPSLILCETFSVVGRVAARQLDIPFVNLMTGHNVDPARFLPLLQTDPRVAISDRCHRAVEILRERYALPDASPFCYFTGFSSHLNICCEPPEFLTPDERKVFEPIAFFGCIPSDSQPLASPGKQAAYFGDGPQEMRIYACFGTIVPRYYADAALGVLQALSGCVGKMANARALISLGGVSLNGALTKLAEPNVKVVEYADQWAALGAADVFLTHHGMNSTHEAIIHRVPMLSYPFFWDQPGLAERCRSLGIAIPVSAMPRGPVNADDMQDALRQIRENRQAISANLERAWQWERDVIANRGAVLKLIEGLA